MARKAYIHIQCEAGKIAAAVTTLREIPGVSAADAVAGAYDIIATVQADDADDIAKIVLNSISGVPGVKSTITSLAVNVELTPAQVAAADKQMASE